MIPGFDEGVVGLPRGSKAYLFIPPALGYGAEGSGPIPANSELVFYIEIQ
jgi:FKBP-type peptidyl-prolyl cis-trans isomerase